MLLLAPTPAPSGGGIVGSGAAPTVVDGAHLMSPTAVAILLLLALLVDWMSVGPNSFRDRLAFCMAVPAVFEGFNGGPLDRLTVGAITAAINRLKAAGGDSYISGANTEILIGFFVGLVFIYAIGCLAPEKWSKRMGPYARLAFSRSGGIGPGGPAGPGGAKRQLNWRLWLCAVLLGLMAELPAGLVGELVRIFVSTLDVVMSWVPGLLFGGG